MAIHNDLGTCQITKKNHVRTGSKILKLLNTCNSFFIQGLKSTEGECFPLKVKGHQIGILRPSTAAFLAQFPNVFIRIFDGSFELNPQLDTFESRTAAVEKFLQTLRAKGTIPSLKGWRDERFCVWAQYGAEPFFEVERSATSFLGIRAFGCHINGYTKLDDEIHVWLQKRALTKQTYPGMMDSMVGGGHKAGFTAREVMELEADEEASIPSELLSLANAAGTVSFITETERGIHANTEFIYDLELPADFIPKNKDGEVDGFELIKIENLLGNVLSSNYKLTSCPVAIDFLVRRGIIKSDNDLDLPIIQELLHVPLHNLYSHMPKFCTSLAVKTNDTPTTNELEQISSSDEVSNAKSTLESSKKSEETSSLRINENKMNLNIREDNSVSDPELKFKRNDERPIQNSIQSENKNSAIH